MTSAQHTEIIKIYPEKPDFHILDKAVGVLRGGGVVAFPTETVYGLGADAFNTSAVRKVFEAKGRPVDNPLIVHIAEIEQLEGLTTNIPPKARILINAFWPGPLTLVMKRARQVPDIVTAGLETVAVRMPRHQVIRDLLKAFGRGIVGPSANLSGGPSPTRAEHVYADLHGKIDLILDAGQTEIGVESTIVDATVDPPIILRLGGLEQERIEQAIGKVGTTNDDNALRRSPGTRHRHYAPKARVVLFEEGDAAQLSQIMRDYELSGQKVGCLLHSYSLRFHDQNSRCVTIWEAEETLAQHLYDAFREFDRQGVDIIVVEAVTQKGIGAAVMDRMLRAAGKSMNAGIDESIHGDNVSFHPS